MAIDSATNIIEKIKTKQGLKDDRLLIEDINKTIDFAHLGPTSISDWKRRDTLKKELLAYCMAKGLSIDEIFTDQLQVAEDTAPYCARCTLYKNVEIIEDSEETLTVRIGPDVTTSVKKSALNKK